MTPRVLLTDNLSILARDLEQRGIEVNNPKNGRGRADPQHPRL